MTRNWLATHGDAFRDVKVLVTGGAGFIGSHLTDALIDLGAWVVVLDDLSGGSRLNLESARLRAGHRLRFIHGSILDRAVLRRCMAQCRFVFHEAAIGSVPRSVAEPELFQEVNVRGTFEVLEAARDAGVQRVIFAASSSAYGDSPTLPKIETMPTRPKSPYAATKVAGESLLRAYASSYDLDSVSLRYFNIFGPRQNANSAYAAVIAAFARAIWSGERPVIYGDGEQSRDFTCVDNAVHANLLAARAEARLGGEVFNVACGRRISVNELAKRMARAAMRPHLTPRYEPARSGDVLHSLADLSAARAAIGYQPVARLQEGLTATMAWYRRQFQPALSKAA